MRQLSHARISHYGANTFSLRIPRSATPVFAFGYDDNPSPILVSGNNISKPVPMTMVIIVYTFSFDSDIVDRLFRIASDPVQIMEHETYVGSYEHDGMVFHVIAQFTPEIL